ncbi:hypothetical protein A4R35_11155 [Thermogemmatispora tikiterensis]|uniref:Uncharacterized protein n=1 Tax=Thermogemmatispora tikiterensis TaxID=1825093 RepID=A0A328VIX4_9CHLR|nr:hypothetical protein A4R35_11155 [Thermogemmatispora tikiterensis]
MATFSFISSLALLAPKFKLQPLSMTLIKTSRLKADQKNLVPKDCITLFILRYQDSRV